MSSVIPFAFGDSLLRVITKDSEPWFVAADVCRILEIKNSSQAIEPLDDDEKGVCSTYTLGGQQDVLIVSESGFYTLVLRCRDATTPGTVAHRFRKWVTSEVLPSLRRVGGYQMPLRKAVYLGPISPIDPMAEFWESVEGVPVDPKHVSTVRRAVLSAGVVTLSELTRKTQLMKAKSRRAAVAEMVRCGDARVEITGTGGRPAFTVYAA